MAKTYSQTYLFRQYSEYEKKMYEFIINANRIDVESKEFSDVLYDFKRRNVNSVLYKIITSKNVILCINEGRALPKAFKTFVAKDVKEDKNSYKVFIDVTDCVVMKNGQYVCNKMEWLISYVINAMVSYIYTMSENRITGNASILKDGGLAFTRCFSYVIDRMYKISVIRQLKQKIEYFIALYYQINILGKDPDKNYDSIKANAIRISDIESRDAQMVDIMIEDKDFLNLDTFVNALGRVFSLKDIKTSTVVNMWMQAFGTGTVFAMEYFPAFSAMMTNTYVGGYLDQQMTIEKVAGPAMVEFTKTIFQIGAMV